MGEEISKEIAVDGVDVRELYGAQNVYLEQIRALHPALKIVARGSSLKVLGAKSAAERFERRMQGLIDYYLKYGHISREVVAQAFAASGLAADEAPADQDVIVYGNNGTVVRARTVNQQRLVRLYDAEMCIRDRRSSPTSPSGIWASRGIRCRPACRRSPTGYWTISSTSAGT